MGAIDEPPRTPEPVAAPVAEPPSEHAPGETIEALRIGGEVLVRQPALPWMTLTATHARTGSELRVTLRYEVDPFGPRDTASVRWLEPRGAWTDADFVGSWARSGSIPSAGGAIGWRREYALREDGTYTFSAYPPLSAGGRWRRVEGPTPQVTLQGTSTVEAVGLVRDPAVEPSAPGPLRHVSVRVAQSDEPPPSDTPRAPTPDLLPPLVFAPASQREVTTDAEGVLTLTLEPGATTVTIVVGTHRVTLRP